MEDIAQTNLPKETMAETMEVELEEEEDSWIPLTPPEEEKFCGSIGNTIGSHPGSTGQLKGHESNPSLDKEGKKWYYGLALFGDSTLALAMSSLLLLIALATSAHFDGILPFLKRSSPEEIAYRKLGLTPTIGLPVVFQMDAPVDPNQSIKVSEEMRAAFERDGVIAVRGLIDSKSLDALDNATMELVKAQQQQNAAKVHQRPKVLTGRKPAGSQFYIVRQNAIFLPGRSANVTSSFVDVAMMSKIPMVAARLLQQHPDTCTNETVRILRDIFLAKDEEQYVCGWHVDDIGFWPALADAPGVNAWIALDDMPIEHGGGFALAVGSHKGAWRHDAYELTGSTHSFPKGGFKSSSDILHNRPGNGTCNIKDTAPHLHRRLEETKRIYDIKRGDVIFHDRWLFHRTVPFDRDTVSARIASGNEPLVYRRYSVRYGPGSSIIPPGYGTEPSVISREENGGKSADDVAKDDAAWYPKVFPTVDENELDSMKSLAVERLPMAMEKSENRKRLIRPLRNRQH